jgi:hypothetical protein
MEKLMESKWSLREPLYLEKTDDRYEEQLKQLKERGFSDSETWTFFLVIAEFILPRLRRFREISIAHPADITVEDWGDIIDKMIFAFEWAIKSDGMTGDYNDLSEEDKVECWEKQKEGLKLFAEYFMGLWW